MFKMAHAVCCVWKKTRDRFPFIVSLSVFVTLSWLVVNSAWYLQETETLKINRQSAMTGVKTVSTEQPGVEKMKLHLQRPYRTKRKTKGDMEERFARRRTRLQAACTHLKLQRNRAVPQPAQRFLFPTKTSPLVLYCPVPKTDDWNRQFMFRGSTFMRQTFSAVNNMRRPYYWIQRYNRRPVDNYERAIMFFFTRDPYTRLLSAYVDKLWSPNPSFWSSLGKNIIHKFRPNASEISRTCGHDVTFAEAVSYFIQGKETGRELNQHFIPTNEFCGVCNYSYDYIGKMETFAEDAAYILSAINVTMPNPSHPDLVYKAADTAFYTVFFRRNCTSKEAALKRAWRGLQIRGFLSMRARFPLSPRQSKHIRRKDFHHVLVAAVRKSTAFFIERGEQLIRTQGRSSEGHEFSQSELLDLAREQQKKEVLASVYSLVSMADRLRMRELLRPEFELFGYDSKPEAIFSDKFTIDKDIFNLSTV